MVGTRTQAEVIENTEIHSRGGLKKLLRKLIRALFEGMNSTAECVGNLGQPDITQPRIWTVKPLLPFLREWLFHHIAIKLYYYKHTTLKERVSDYTVICSYQKSGKSNLNIFQNH